MRRVELLIAQSRRATESTEFSSETGIQDSEFLEYLNNAQDRCFSRILSVYPNIDMVETEIATAQGVEIVPIPIDAYLRTKLETVEFSSSGLEADYYPLGKSRLRERYRGSPGTPNRYVRRGSNLLIQPAPNFSAGKIRINYYPKLPTLDKRRSKVLAVNLDAATRTIVDLTLDPAILTDEDVTAIQDLGYMCSIDKDGAIHMKAIPVATIDPNTGVVTLDGAFVYTAGETITVGDYVVMGSYASTHSQLDDSCERYLIAHCDWKILKRDSSTDSMEQNAELTAILMEVTDTYKDVDDDINFVPIIDDEYLTY